MVNAIYSTNIDAIMLTRRYVMPGISLPVRSLRGQPASLSTFPDGVGCRLSKRLIQWVLLVIGWVISDVKTIFLPALREEGSGHAAGLPPAGAELAAVEDAVVLVAGRTEHGRSAHPAVADLAVEEIADRAALVT